MPNNPLKNILIKERVKLKDMSFNQKLEYIWEYYKLHIVAFIILILVIS